MQRTGHEIGDAVSVHEGQEGGFGRADDCGKGRNGGVMPGKIVPTCMAHEIGLNTPQHVT